MKIEEIATDKLATVTGGAELSPCDKLRGYTGIFKPQGADERRAAQLCIQDGEPLFKKIPYE